MVTSSNVANDLNLDFEVVNFFFCFSLDILPKVRSDVFQTWFHLNIKKEKPSVNTCSHSTIFRNVGCTSPLSTGKVRDTHIIALQCAVNDGNHIYLLNVSKLLASTKPKDFERKFKICYSEITYLIVFENVYFSFYSQNV